MTWLIFFLLFFPFSVFAAAAGDVVMNEIAWMGTTESYNNEWIELYNNTPAEINLDGWILRSTDGTPKINLKGIIPGQWYFLLERTDDNTLPSQAADQIYTGALGNSGEHLELVDAQGNVIDDVNSWGSWFAGDNSTKQTMERKNPKPSGSDPDGWETSTSSGGTPKAQNSISSAMQDQEPPQTEITTFPIQESTSTYYASNESSTSSDTAIESSALQQTQKAQPSPTTNDGLALPPPIPIEPDTNKKISQNSAPQLQKEKDIPTAKPAKPPSKKIATSTAPQFMAVSPASSVPAKQAADETNSTKKLSSIADTYTQPAGQKNSLLTMAAALGLAILSAGVIFLLKRRLPKT